MTNILNPGHMTLKIQLLWDDTHNATKGVISNHDFNEVENSVCFLSKIQC